MRIATSAGIMSSSLTSRTSLLITLSFIRSNLVSFFLFDLFDLQHHVDIYLSLQGRRPLGTRVNGASISGPSGKGCKDDRPHIDTIGLTPCIYR